ncbi:AraC family transcriptional regulator [Pedobacter aquatilis]|uniref:helix-turn-helix domain-containing protein n=1 Tax=Pedobacter aquatilis TaxID=351343 RepID=UPI0029312339|nr:AraC family transcriptional regulator [Pedobacter aquatilis]
MQSSENIADFYKRIFGLDFLPESVCELSLGHFNVFSRDKCAVVSPYRRRDYFKISLIIGKGRLHYADRWIYIDKPALLFSNPKVPFSWEAESDEQDGWFCLFTEKFVHGGNAVLNLQDNSFFKIGGEPVFFLSESQVKDVSAIFLKMKAEIESDYIHKYDLIRNYLQLLIHEALKMRPAESFEQYKNASQRVVSLFMELMERQFPIDGPENVLKLKTATDFASNLNVHVNSLNRSLKDITGKTTSELISERIIQEAKALLHHTDWNVNEIAYGLGFEEPAYFTNYFKKRTGMSPVNFRIVPV